MAAVPGPHWRVDGFAVFGCGAAVVLFAKRTTRFYLPIETRMEKQAANVEAAVEKLERYIAENPQDGEALTLLGAAMMSLQRFEEAAQYYRRLVR